MIFLESASSSHDDRKPCSKPGNLNRHRLYIDLVEVFSIIWSLVRYESKRDSNRSYTCTKSWSIPIKGKAPTARRVKYHQFIERLDDRIFVWLSIAAPVVILILKLLVRAINELLESLITKFVFSNLRLEVFTKRFAAHIVHDLARRVECTLRLASLLPRFFGHFREKVLKDSSEHLGSIATCWN